MAKTTNSILMNAERTLNTAKFGLNDFLGSSPERRDSGLRNFIVFSRSVTNVLQNLRSTVGKEEFNKWYDPWQTDMKSDPLMKAFYTMRSEISKEGVINSSISMHIEHLDTSDLKPILDNPPPNATNFFIGDQYGGSGWEIKVDDSSTNKYYVELPNSVKINHSIELKDLPNIPGENLDDRDYSTKDKLYYYYNFLERLVTDANNVFKS
ncbi:hypothetical protein AB4027_07235 [Alkalibacterium putridalgicola]|uniref:hypothetical protein n=1 Tax=Alkalibacterium putridalgicola TaxID=426703 RepID=UPI0034CE801E